LEEETWLFTKSHPGNRKSKKKKIPTKNKRSEVLDTPNRYSRSTVLFGLKG